MRTEAQIEKDLIAKLKGLKYTYHPDIQDKKALQTNFRAKFEQLNKVHLSDAEFARLLDEVITADVFAAAKKLREMHTFIREDDTPLNYTLVNTKDWCKNDFEVINQLRINTDSSFRRYDIILLMNGVPVVQIELKDTEVVPRKAIEQIVNYKNEVGNGYTNTLLCFIQLFISSNQNNTYYFANNSKEHFNFNADERYLPVYKFAKPDNTPVNGLNEFSEKFLAKCHLSQMISRYIVLVMSEKKILVMRPYQIYAVKAIIDCIHQNRGNGYIWHTTGSGKTLTSFKAATLLKDNPDIDKCLFVVDRKDLDRQTREEFNKFQENCVEENTNTETLVKRLLSDDYANKVIVTTIQKLGLALDENSKRNNDKKDKGYRTFTQRLEPLRQKRMAIIFDECHRSQFGENHQLIAEFFPKAQLFGFTGTPIFDKNALYRKYDGTDGMNKTTEDIFEKPLHTYTITNAIEDKNVLQFHVDYFKPDGMKGDGITTPEVRKKIAETILKKHDAVTHSRKFNAILATASINEAIEYYHAFKELQTKQQRENSDYTPLNIACVFSPPISIITDKTKRADVKQVQEDLEQERVDNEKDPQEKKAALTQIIADYNQQYGTNHTITEFDTYYQEVQKRIKFQKYSNKDYPHKNKIDITIVVDMLLTGFDSLYLNTLYIDKNLKYHGLIQAFSRTNRILNATKPHGNILDFRGQETAVDEAIKLFSGVSDKQPREIWLVPEVTVVVEAYKKAVDNLENFMRKQGLVCKPSEVPNIKGDIARSEFINHFKEVQRLNTQLNQYTDLDDTQKTQLTELLPEEDLRGFRGAYLETAQRLKPRKPKQDDPKPNDPQLDFEFVLFASAMIDYDYIMQLIAKNTGQPNKYKMTSEELISLIASSSTLMEEREDMTDYINSLDWSKGQDEKTIREGYQRFKLEKANREIADIAQKHGLQTIDLQSFINHILNRMIFDGELLTDLLEPLDLGWKKRRLKELALMDDLVPLLKKRANGNDISGLTAYE